MPKFKPNTSTAMKKRTPYKMKGYTYPGTAPLKYGPERKPMLDNDKDGIPDTIDADGGDGSKNKNTKSNTRDRKRGGGETYKMSEAEWWNPKTQTWE